MQEETTVSALEADLLTLSQELENDEDIGEQSPEEQEEEKGGEHGQ